MSLDQTTLDKLTDGTGGVYVLTEYDKNIVLRSGWIPATNYSLLEELREKHEALIERRNRTSAEVSALHAKFSREDTAKQAALDAAYRNGDEPEAIEVTSPQERKLLMDEANAHNLAAARAVEAFVTDEVLPVLRGNPPEGWEPYLRASSLQAPTGGVASLLLGEIAGQEAELQAQIGEAQRVIVAAGEKLREFVPLKTWIARNGNGATGQFLMGNDLPVPAAYTQGTKPQGMSLPGWRGDASDDPQSIAEAVDESAESGVIDIAGAEWDDPEDQR